MIKHFQPSSEEENVFEGTFKSTIFKNENDNELTIYIDVDDKSYAEECIEHFNSLPSDTINLICENIIKCYQKFGGINDNFTLPSLENPKDILKYCWFHTMCVEFPRVLAYIAYFIVGEGDWGECIYFTIRDDKVIYVGREEVYPLEDKEYYKSLEDNCLYLED